jgi:hypothetical protein
MLMDVQARAPGAAQQGTGAEAGIELYPSEQGWISGAAAFGDDILWVAPAGDAGGPVYPADLAAPSDRLLSVGAVGCAGRRWRTPRAALSGGGGGRADILAPGVDITAAAPANGPVAALALAGGDAVALRVAAAGSAAGQLEAGVVLGECSSAGACAASGDARLQLCALEAGGSEAPRSVCNALDSTSCPGGLVILAPRAERDLPSWEEEVRSVVGNCGPAAPLSSRPPVLLAVGADASRLADALRGGAAGSPPAGLLSVNPSKQATRTGTPQAAAFVAGAAARLMERFPLCNASDTAAALLSTAALLKPDGTRTGARGRGGLLQVKDAEDWLAARPCASAAAPPGLPGGGGGVSGGYGGYGGSATTGPWLVDEAGPAAARLPEQRRAYGARQQAGGVGPSALPRRRR